MRVRDHACREVPGGRAHQGDRSCREVIRGDPVAYMPERRDTRKMRGRAAVERAFERVRVHEVGVERTDPAAQAIDIGGEGSERPRVEARAANALLADVAQPRREGHHLGIDPELPDLRLQRPLLAEDHVQSRPARRARESTRRSAISPPESRAT